MRQQAETVQQSEAEHAERTQRGYAIETEVRENRERLSQLKLEIDRALAQRRHNEERCAELVVRSAASEAELAQAQQRLTALAAERDATGRFWSRRRAIWLPRKGTGPVPAGSRQQRRQAWRKWSVSRNNRGSRSSRRFRGVRLRNQLTQAEERLAGVDREARRLQAEIDECERAGGSIRGTARPARAGV